MRSVWCAVAFSMWWGVAPAQVRIGAKAGQLSHTEGPITLQTRPVAIVRGEAVQLPEGGYLRSWQGGRAEVLLNACAVLHLGDNSSVRLSANVLTDTVVELLTGSAIVQADRIVPKTRVTMVVRGAAVPLTTAGLYRFDAEPPRVLVRAGKVAVQRKGAAVMVGARRMALLDGTATTGKFNLDHEDALDRYNHRRVVALAADSGLTARMARESAERDANRKQLPEPQTHANDGFRSELETTPVPTLSLPTSAARSLADRPLICLPSGK